MFSMTYDRGREGHGGLECVVLTERLQVLALLGNFCLRILFPATNNKVNT